MRLMRLELFKTLTHSTETHGLSDRENCLYSPSNSSLPACQEAAMEKPVDALADGQT